MYSNTPSVFTLLFYNRASLALIGLLFHIRASCARPPFQIQTPLALSDCSFIVKNSFHVHALLLSSRISFLDRTNSPFISRLLEIFYDRASPSRISSRELWLADSAGLVSAGWLIPPDWLCCFRRIGFGWLADSAGLVLAGWLKSVRGTKRGRNAFEAHLLYFVTRPTLVSHVAKGTRPPSPRARARNGHARRHIMILLSNIPMRPNMLEPLQDGTSNGNQKQTNHAAAAAFAGNMPLFIARKLLQTIHGRPPHYIGGVSISRRPLIVIQSKIWKAPPFPTYSSRGGQPR